MFKKLTLLALALLLLVSPTFVSAQSEGTDVQSQIQSLLAQIKQLQTLIAQLQGGSSTTSLTCNSFSDVSYGNFDNKPGGRVSQLQAWLGIPSSVSGFGTYGHKTKVAWNGRCRGTHSVVSPTMATLSTTTATIGTQITITGDGFIHLLISTCPGCTMISKTEGNYISLESPSAIYGKGLINSIDSLDGKTIVFTVPSYVDSPTQSYSGGVGALPPNPLMSGLYQLSVGNAHGMSNSLPITFSIPVSPTPTVTIDQGSLIATSSTFVLTGSATNISQITIEVGTTSSMSACTGGNFPVVNGRWSANMTFVNCLPTTGAYRVHISSPQQMYQNLVTDTLMVRNP